MPSLPDAAIDFVIGGDAALHAALQAEANAFANEDWEAVAEAHHRLEEVNGYHGAARAGKLLHGLGFSAEQQQHAVPTVSGGWRVRLNLARALMTPGDQVRLPEAPPHPDPDPVLTRGPGVPTYTGQT